MSWKRIACLVGGGLAGLGAVLIPPAAPYLGPVAAGLIGWALPAPGSGKRKDATS